MPGRVPARLGDLIRRRANAAAAERRARRTFEEQILGELAAELPDVDLPDNLADCRILYGPGAASDSEEDQEHWDVMRDALDRMERGR